MNTPLKTKSLCKEWRLVKSFVKDKEKKTTHSLIVSFYKSGTIVYIGEVENKEIRGVGRWKWKDAEENTFYFFKKFILSYNEEPDTFKIISLTSSSLKVKQIKAFDKNNCKDTKISRAYELILNK